MTPSTGRIALHGGGEFQPGDEPFLAALLAAAQGGVGDGPLRVVVVPVAAARQRPDLAAAHGVEALTRVAREAGIDATVEAVLVVDGPSAADPGHVARLAAASIVHLPGGDPGLVPGVLRGTDAWQAIVAAHRRGAVIAGASAGAMGLASTTWTANGFVPGLGLVADVVVVPHFESFDRTGRDADVAHVRAARLGVLGLDERTGVIREAPGQWRVAGAGRVVWQPAGGESATGRHGDLLPIAG